MAGRVEDVPGLDLDWDRGVDCLEVELEAGRERGRTLVSFAVNLGDWNEVRNREGNWEKSLPRRGGCYVLAGCEVGDFIGKRDTEQGEGVGVAVGGCQVGEKAEQVLRVQFTAIEGTSDVNATLDVFG